MDTAQRRLPHRNPALLSREVDGEFVVVDEAANAAHQLTGTVAEVWRAIEGGAAPALEDERVDQILAELSELGLLVEPKGMTRRAMLQRSGFVVAATGLSTIALPAAVAHASTGVATALTVAASGSAAATGSSYPVSVTVRRPDTGAAVAGMTVTLASSAGQPTLTGVTDSSGQYVFPYVTPSTAGPVVLTANGSTTINGTTSTTYTAPPAQTLQVRVGTYVTALQPSSGYRGTTATVQAVGFTAGSLLTVSVGGVAATVSAGGTVAADGSSTVSFVIPEAAPLGAQNIVVSNGTQSATAGTQFRVIGTVTISSPTSAQPFNPGFKGRQTFTIVGTGFVSGLTVTLTNAADAVSFAYVSSTTISLTFTGTNGKGAKGDLTVTNPDGGTATVIGGIQNGG